MTLSREERETILRSKLFAEIQPEQLDTLLSCLGAELREYEPGSWVIQEGERVTEVGLVLTGNARSLKLDGDAEPLIISLLERGSSWAFCWLPAETTAVPCAFRRRALCGSCSCPRRS